MRRTSRNIGTRASEGRKVEALGKNEASQKRVHSREGRGVRQVTHSRWGGVEGRKFKSDNSRL